MFKLSPQFLLSVALIFVGLAAAATFLPETGNHAQAQPGCDDPPIDVGNLQRVWDKTDFCTYEPGVFDEIISGGVPRDGIPPIDSPEFDSVDVARDWLQPQSPVVAVSLNDIARAYPLAILTRHEIVNDVVGGEPVAVTFCPLCNSAIIFERTVDDQVFRFGVSGLLRNSDLIMWDDVTQSWWQQFTGTGIVGQYTGHQLTILPSQVVGFGAFAEQYRDGEVLSPGGRSYGSNPYVDYDSNDRPFLFRGQIDERLFATSRVLAGVIDGIPIAYPFETLASAGVINDTVGSQEVVALWQPGATSALDRSDIDSSRDVGMAALFDRTLDGQVLTFVRDGDGVIRDEQTGSAWNVFGTATDGELAGQQLRQRLAAPHFWFAWAAFQPDTLIYGQQATD
jgi:hypothetical protein